MILSLCRGRNLRIQRKPRPCIIAIILLILSYMPHQPSIADDRPDFMVALGLLPPYARDDVRQAYKLKARDAHPDSGGTPEDFKALSDAYEQALEFVEFSAGRRGWLAAHIERYAADQELIEEIEQFGGTAEIEKLDWRRQSFGDFAQVAERIVGLRLNGPGVTNEVVSHIAQYNHLHDSLRLLDLAESEVDDDGIGQLAVFRRLIRLDLRETQISAKGLGDILPALTHLEQLHVGGTGIGWWQRRRLAKLAPKVQVVTARAERLSAGPKTRFSSIAEMAAAR